APALEAAHRLAEKGIECTVVNARFVKPLDSSLILDVARRTKRVVTVEENALWSGFGSAVIELLDGSHITDLRVERIGLPDEFVEHGSQGVLRAKYNLDADGIAQRVISSFPELIPLKEAKR
ncbi:MAG: 1-deoxy-D-xylulose-5-phosphate synthase, partial [Dehalococcoidia bacterium]|nr:1-deoxy-D-xylulose-5-phosphate synthase [Dehalococcoidia bacterium]